MNEVVNFNGQGPSEPRKPRKPNDQESDAILRSVTEWRIARAQQQIEWAKSTHANAYTNSQVDYPCSLEWLDRMREAENFLAQFEPGNIMAAWAMLEVAIEILAHEAIDPEATLASGPVGDIVRNVLRALESVKGDTPIGRKLGLID